MQVEREAFDREICVAQFEEALLEDYAEDFFAQEIFGFSVTQFYGQSVFCFDLHEFVLFGDGGEFEEIEGALDGIDGEEAGLVLAGEIVVDAVEVEGDVDLGDALEWAEAEIAK